jgi:hypothetical protein
LKKIKTLTVQFDNDLPPKLVPAFRGAIIEKVNRDHILFHQHKSDTEVLYKYPLVQYKSLNKKPAIVCLGDGVGELYRLLNQPNLNIKLHDKKVELIIDKLEMNNFELIVEPLKKHEYTLVNWLGLNSVNNQKFENIQGIKDKIDFLENLLKANILSFAKGLDWTIEENISVSIVEVKDQRIIRFKGVPLNAFDLIFETNVKLPLFIGLGKSVSHGYGMLKSKKK